MTMLATRRGLARMRLVAGVCVVALLAAGVQPAAAGKAKCSTTTDGPATIWSATRRFGAGGSRATLTVELSNLTDAANATSTKLMLGKKLVLGNSAFHTASGVTTVTEFGVGFHGIKRLELTTADGQTFHGTLDGRAVTSTGGGTPSLTFDDGQPPPVIKVKKSIGRLVKKASKAATGLQCANTSGGVENRLFDKCSGCKLGCMFSDTAGIGCMALAWIRAYGCSEGLAAVCAGSLGAGCVIAVAACIGGYALDGYNCSTNGVSCDAKCDTGDCCEVACAGVQGGCCQQGEVCCGPDGTAENFHCANASQCCGTVGQSAITCGDRGYGPEFCIDAANKVCCEIDLKLPIGNKPGGTPCGADCCPPDWTCCAAGNYCAPPGTECCSTPRVSSQQNYFCPVGQKCADPGTNLCCAQDAGPACGDKCCPQGQGCDGAYQCCNATDTCGSSCCPSHICLNGTTCCEPPNNVCGGNCCAPLQACCNGQCCTGSCVGGQCCSPERSCGAVCCADGWACTDAATGTCAPCPGGQTGCAPVAGNPTCCDVGAQCCSNGACCASPSVCCAPTGLPIGCYTPDQCIQ